MGKTIIVTDSASDITKENCSALGIEMLNIKIAVGDKTYDEVDIDEFYSLLENCTELPFTSMVTAFEFYETYEKLYLDGYEDIIAVLLNSKGSGTYDNAVFAAASFYEKHPEAKDKIRIKLIDSRTYTCAFGYPVTVGAKMLKDGKSANEVIEYLEKYLETATVYFAPYTLKFAKKSGRIPAAAAFVGDILGLRPIMKLFNQEIETDEKIMGDRNLIPRMAEKACDEMEKGAPYCVIYGNDLALRDELTALMTEKTGYAPADTYRVGAAIAINAGPKIAGVLFSAKK